jgi:uncharacterized protein
VIDFKEKRGSVCRDPDDDLFLTVAIIAKAPFLVIGDKDLPELRESKSIKIISPQEYLALHKN